MRFLSFCSLLSFVLLSRVVLVDEFPDGIQPLKGAMAFGKRNVDFQQSISPHELLGQVRCDTKHHLCQ